MWKCSINYYSIFLMWFKKTAGHMLWCTQRRILENHKEWDRNPRTCYYLRLGGNNGYVHTFCIVLCAYSTITLSVYIVCTSYPRISVVLGKSDLLILMYSMIFYITSCFPPNHSKFVALTCIWKLMNSS